MSNELEVITKELTDLKVAVGKLTEAIQRLLILEERQANQTERLKEIRDDLDSAFGRLRELERNEPTNQRTNALVEKAIWLIVAGVMGAALSWLVVGKPAIPSKVAVSVYAAQENKA